MDCLQWIKIGAFGTKRLAHKPFPSSCGTGDFLVDDEVLISAPHDKHPHSDGLFGYFRDDF